MAKRAQPSTPGRIDREIPQWTPAHRRHRARQKLAILRKFERDHAAAGFPPICAFRRRWVAQYRSQNPNVRLSITALSEWTCNLRSGGAAAMVDRNGQRREAGVALHHLRAVEASARQAMEQLAALIAEVERVRAAQAGRKPADSSNERELPTVGSGQ